MFKIAVVGKNVQEIRVYSVLTLLNKYITNFKNTQTRFRCSLKLIPEQLVAPFSIPTANHDPARDCLFRP